MDVKQDVMESITPVKEEEEEEEIGMEGEGLTLESPFVSEAASAEKSGLNEKEEIGTQGRVGIVEPSILLEKVPAEEQSLSTKEEGKIVLGEGDMRIKETTPEQHEVPILHPTFPTNEQPGDQAELPAVEFITPTRIEAETEEGVTVQLGALQVEGGDDIQEEGVISEVTTVPEESLVEGDFALDKLEEDMWEKAEQGNIEERALMEPVSVVVSSVAEHPKCLTDSIQFPSPIVNPVNISDMGTETEEIVSSRLESQHDARSEEEIDMDGAILEPLVPTGNVLLEVEDGSVLREQKESVSGESKQREQGLVSVQEESLETPPVAFNSDHIVLDRPSSIVSLPETGTESKDLSPTSQDDPSDLIEYKPIRENSFGAPGAFAILPASPIIQQQINQPDLSPSPIDPISLSQTATDYLEKSTSKLELQQHAEEAKQEEANQTVMESPESLTVTLSSSPFKQSAEPTLNIESIHLPDSEPHVGDIADIGLEPQRDVPGEEVVEDTPEIESKEPSLQEAEFSTTSTTSEQPIAPQSSTVEPIDLADSELQVDIVNNVGSELQQNAYREEMVQGAQEESAEPNLQQTGSPKIPAEESVKLHSSTFQSIDLADKEPQFGNTAGIGSEFQQSSHKEEEAQDTQEEGFKQLDLEQLKLSTAIQGFPTFVQQIDQIQLSLPAVIPSQVESELVETAYVGEQYTVPASSSELSTPSKKGKKKNGKKEQKEDKGNGYIHPGRSYIH